MSFLNTIIKAFVGDKSQKDVKATQPYISKIKAIEPALAALSHDELRAKTTEFKEKIKQSGQGIAEEILRSLQQLIAKKG